MVVDITNDGQQSSTDPIMDLDPETGRVSGGASFAASFGPGRYRAFTCVDFKGNGFELVGVILVSLRRMDLEDHCWQGSPKEFGSWLGNFPVKQTTNLHQLYTSFRDELGALLTFAPNGNGVHLSLSNS